MKLGLEAFLHHFLDLLVGNFVGRLSGLDHHHAEADDHKGKNDMFHCLVDKPPDFTVQIPEGQVLIAKKLSNFIQENLPKTEYGLFSHRPRINALGHKR